MNMKNKRPQKSPETNQNNRRNFGILMIMLITLGTILIVGRFFSIATSHKARGVDLKTSVKQLYMSKTEIKAKRGTIYDAANQPIAEDTTSYSVYIVLSKSAVAYGKKLYLPDNKKDEAAKVLSENLPISYKRVRKILSANPKKYYQVELGTAGENISLETKKKIDSYKLSGINFTPKQARLYPNGYFSSHIVGLAESENNKLIGVMGIEKVYNKQLSGKDGVSTEATDSHGVRLPGSTQKKQAVQNGDNIYTTLDPKIQSTLETQLTTNQKKFNATSINAVVMDAKTGKVLAASQRPTFNSQTKKGLEQVWRNTLIEDSYEPGSTMKVLTVAAAINSGHYNPNEVFGTGSYSIDGQSIYDWNRSGWGYLTVSQGFARSSNVVMAHLEQKMGKKTWMNYIRKFGLLRPVGLGLGSETSGAINYKYPIDQANTAYGQGINVSVMQMMQAFSAIANDGKMVQPRIIDKIVDPNNGKTVFQSKTKVVGRPISAKTSKKVIDMMKGVVYDKDGLGHDYQIDGYKIAAKTGTAQIANPNGGGYMSGDANYIFSVVGIAPADKPRYIVYITVKQPKSFNNNNATENIAKIFKPVMKQVLDTNSSQNKQISKNIPNVIGEDTKNAKEKLASLGFNPVVIGNGNEIVEQSEKAGSVMVSGSKVLLLSNGQKTMPDLNGWSRSDITKLSKLTSIKVTFKGSGYAYYQSIAAGGELKNSDIIEIKLK